MAPSPITSWQIDGETMETGTDFTFLGSKITGDGDWNHEIKGCLLLGRKVMTNLDSILKSEDTILLKKVWLGLSSQSYETYGFSSSMYGYESWSIKKTIWWRIDAWCLQTAVMEKTLESPLDSKDIKPANSKRNQPLEKGMAIHSSILAWRVPWTEEPGGLQSMELQSWTQMRT